MDTTHLVRRCALASLLLAAPLAGMAAAPATPLAASPAASMEGVASGARLLERTMMQRPGYPEYAARTSMFVPLPPKRG